MTKHLGWIGLVVLSMLMLASELFACPERMSDLTNEACRSTQATLLAGERIATSATKSYMAVRNEANVSIVSKTSAVTIGGGVANDTHLLGLQIATALTGSCALTGFADSDGTAQTYTIATGATGLKDFFAALNTAGALTITCYHASDDNLVMVLWRPAI